MYLKGSAFLGIFLLIWLTGCVTSQVDVAWPEKRSLGKDVQAYQPPRKPKTTLSTPLKLDEPTGILTLRQALSMALMKNPELASYSWEVRAREAMTLQAGLLPNPEIVIETENFGGTGTLKRFEVAETTIQLSQLVELAGKPSKRKQVAALERNLAGWDYEAKRLDVLTNVTKAFVDVLAAQENLVLKKDLVRLAEDVLKTVSEQVKVGKVSPVEETRARVALASSRIEMERAKRQLENSRKILATSWGSVMPAFEKVKGDIYLVYSIPSADQLARLVYQNPEIARWTTEMEHRRAVVKLEDAKRIPDLTLSGGVRRLNETGEKAFVFALSIPIPIFNRNQGGSLEARYRLIKAEQELKDTEMRVLAVLSESYQELSSAYTEAKVLKDEVLPGAQSAFDAIEEGYRQGKFSYLDVLDSQRTLFEARAQYIDVLASYHKAVADMERLIGTPMESIKKEESDAK